MNKVFPEINCKGDYCSKKLLPPERRCKIGLINRFHIRDTVSIFEEAYDTRSHLTQSTASYKKIFRIIHQQLLKHKWENVTILCKPLASLDTKYHHTIAEVLWRMGNQLNFYHRNRNIEKMLTNKQLMSYNFERVNQPQVLLEYCFSLMVDGNFAKAREELATYNLTPKVTGPGRYFRFENIMIMKDVINGFLGILDYVTWYNNVISYDVTYDLEFAQSITAKFRDVLFESGNCWDIFLHKHVSLLHHYKKEEIIEEDLTKYSETHLDNPNAHLYLWEFLDENYPSNDRKIDEKITCLRRVARVYPSHASCLRLHSLLLEKSNASDDFELKLESFEVLFSLLDYTCWRWSLEAWSSLLTALQLDDNLTEVMTSVWRDSGRCEWWPSANLPDKHDQQQMLWLTKKDIFTFLDSL